MTLYVRLFLAALLTLGAWSPLAAQRRCSKGIPCGNSCIAANKTCRVGAGTAVTADRAPAPRPEETRDSALTTSTAPVRQSGLAADVVEGMTIRSYFAALKSNTLALGVVLHGLDKSERRMEQGVLESVEADHIVLMATGARARIPFAAIRMVYTSLDASDKNLHIVVRP